MLFRSVRDRVLFPYFGGFAKLVSAGVDFVRIDKVFGEMEFWFAIIKVVAIVGMIVLGCTW